ncbi:hypothetical protein C4K42_27750, partial [Escherichia coli]
SHLIENQSICKLEQIRQKVTRHQLGYLPASVKISASAGDVSKKDMITNLFAQFTAMKSIKSAECEANGNVFTVANGTTD